MDKETDATWYELLAQWYSDYIIIQLLVGALITFIAVIIIGRLIHSFFKRTSFIEERKEKTLEAMINSTVKYTATIGFIIFALDAVGVEITKILAGAGVLGIILGFGAQSLIKDILSGIFLLYEKQLHKGDFVAVNNTYFGTVEDIGLRFLKVREWSGKLLTISNGQVTAIQNYNIERMRVIEKVTTSYYQDPKEVFKVLELACEQLNQELDLYLKRDESGDEYLEKFQVYGVTSLNDQFRGYQYTVIGLVSDLYYWTAAKETRRIIAEMFYEHNIKMAEQHIEMRSASSEKL